MKREVGNECQSNEDLAEEQKAIKRALENYSELGFSGGIICVDGKCVECEKTAT